jgi:hypothetical protein
MVKMRQQKVHLHLLADCQSQSFGLCVLHIVHPTSKFSADWHLPNAFRHIIKIPDDVMPEAWRNGPNDYVLPEDGVEIDTSEEDNEDEEAMNRHLKIRNWSVSMIFVRVVVVVTVVLKGGRSQT